MSEPTTVTVRTYYSDQYVLIDLHAGAWIINEGRWVRASDADLARAAERIETLRRRSQETIPEEDRRWLCRYCGKVIPGRVSSLPCPASPDDNHRRGEPWFGE